MSRSIVIMAGGTGGHIFPALAVADILRAEGWEVTWLGVPNSMEAELVPKHGYAIEWVNFSGLRGNGVLRKIMLPFNLVRAMWQSAVALFNHRPNVVLGMGGYITVPGGLVAWILRRPIVIHEQNSVAGMSNKLLAKLANKVMSGFPNVLPKAQWCGNPVRENIVNLAAPQQRYSTREGVLKILLVGGSLGAKALNEAMPKALALLPENIRPQVLHQTGKKNFDEVNALYQASGVSADVQAFISDMAGCYAEADLVICRAGALTVAELAAAGVASVLVPYPHAVDDHQTHNAKFMSERGAAILMPQEELSAESLSQLLTDMTQQGREKLCQMAECARDVAKQHAAADVAQVCREYAE